MKYQQNSYSPAYVLLFLTGITFIAYTIGGGPSAYSAPMNAVPVLMVIFTLYFFWKASISNKGGK